MVDAYKYIPSIPYYGGKSGRTKLGKWVASLLPQRLDCVYVELCLGMGGVMLQREPSVAEILNDLNDRVVNFWRAVRDHGDELEHLMKHTPYSLSEFKWAVEHLDDMSLSVPKRALAFVTAIQSTIFNADGSLRDADGEVRTSEWVLITKKGGIKRVSQMWETIQPFRERLRNAQLYNNDALKLVKRTQKRANAVLYFDPPYDKRHAKKYAVNEIDKQAFVEAFQQHKGAIAISGCDDEWDELGWEKHELKISSMATGKANKGKATKRRVEQAWCNYSQEEKEQLW